jgi:hypothetical protein
MSLRLILWWMPMIVIAIANGTLRQFVLLKYMDELKAHQLSTIILIVFCAVYLWFVFPGMQIGQGRQALMTGLLYVILTIIFEFGLGRMNNRSWDLLLQDYHIFKGRIWPLFLLALLVLPYLIYLLRHKT